MKNNNWINGIIGLAVADALGSPGQFLSRDELRKNPITEMVYCDIYDKPAGAWTDDTSMTLCMLDSIRTLGEVDAEDIMDAFVDWMFEDCYTPTGEAFDEGNTCVYAIERYRNTHDVDTCGKTGERANGNGSLMRTLPVCLYYAEKTQTGEATVEQAVRDIHKLSALTHNHIRACMACGLYFFSVREMIYGEGSLNERLQRGMDQGFAYYGKNIANLVELAHYGRLRDLSEFAKLPDAKIKSSGYVVAALEAAIWSLITTGSYRNCILRAVNLGDDTDTVGAIAGGLAGLYYGYDAIPEEWRDALIKREWIEEMCVKEPEPKSYPYEVDKLTDIHMHVIPEVDDGAESMEESITELKMVISQGVSRVIATPHSSAFDYDPVNVHTQYEKLKKEVEAQGLPIELHLGCEMLVYPDDVDECIEKLKKGIYPTLAGTDYVLTEFVPEDHTEEDALYIIDRIVETGYKPIIAHVERYALTNVESVRKMKEHGAWMQINAYSVKEEKSKRTRTNANDLLREQLVDIIGTDGHRLDHRPPAMKKGVKEIMKKCEKEYAERILTGTLIFRRR